MLHNSQQQHPSSPSRLVDASNAGVGTLTDMQPKKYPVLHRWVQQIDGTQNDGGTQDENMQQSLTPTLPPPDAIQDFPTSSPNNLPNESNNYGTADYSTLVHDAQLLPPAQRFFLCDQPSCLDDESIQCSYICSQTGLCPKQFHKRCLINHGYIPPYDIHAYFCMRCSTKQTNDGYVRKIANGLCSTLGNYSFSYPCTPSVRDGNDIRPTSMQRSEMPPETVDKVMILDNTIATAVANVETGLRPIT